MNAVADFLFLTLVLLLLPLAGSAARRSEREKKMLLSLELFADTESILRTASARSLYYCTRPLAILITSDTTRSLSLCVLFFFFLLQPAAAAAALLSARDQQPSPPLILSASPGSESPFSGLAVGFVAT
jgi:hypothetical protein